jgi:hypothetical protein
MTNGRTGIRGGLSIYGTEESGEVPMNIRNCDVVSISAEIPPGHRHLRTTVLLADGTELVLQEATVAAMVRSYTAVKTHPTTTAVKLTGRHLDDRKDGYAEWQLLEEESSDEAPPS